MRKRALYFGIFVILLVFLFPIISSVHFSFDHSDLHTELERLPLNFVSDDSNGVNLTWTSRTQQVPKLLENDSTSVGDHVVLNATFHQTQNVTECKLIIWNIQANVNTTIGSVGSSISFDTYYLDRSNQTYSIMVNGTTSTNDSVIHIWENVSICNFFTPELNVFYPTEYDDLVFNITWNCVDLNQDDVNYYSVWLSRDNGVTYLLLEQNLTQTWFCWNSSTWLKANYIAMIRAYSVDYSSSDCRVDEPPSSYWPGDYSDITTYQFDGGGIGSGPLGPLPSFSISTTSSIYEFGSTNNTIIVVFQYYARPPPPGIEYSVTDNGSLWFQGLYMPELSYGSFAINIDGLSVGTHDLSIGFSYGTNNPQSLTIVVTSHTSTNTSTTTPTSTTLNWPLIQAMAVGVSIGSVVIIAVVVILSIRLRRNQVV